MRFGPLDFQLYGIKPGFFFRIFGYGASVCLAKDHVPLFSERYGYSKPTHLCGLRIKWLKPRDF